MYNVQSHLKQVCVTKNCLKIVPVSTVVSFHPNVWLRQTTKLANDPAARYLTW